MEASQLGDLAAIDLRSGEAELLFKGLLEDGKIAVFTENQRKHDPIISRTDLAIGTVVAGEAFASPGGNVGRLPGTGDFFCFVKVRRGMANVAGGKQVSGTKGLGGFANQDAVHDDFSAGREVLRNELLFGGNVR